MYATSKLIIPPKPARNIPYIPKLRIKLRPSVIKGRVLSSAKQDALQSTVLRGKDVTDNDLKGAYVYSQFMNGESRQSDDSQVLNRDEPDGSNEDSIPSKFRVQGTLFKRASGKKQNILLAEEIDLDGPESILTKINLKAIINRETFYALPVEAQRMLADLLPVYDRNKHTWSSFTGIDTGPDAAKHTSSSPESSIPNDDSPVWLHPSALSNEFFGKALQDYASRQAQGDFAPRVRNRAGLRASTSNRCRYLLPTSTESPYERVSTRSFPCNSTPRLNHVRRTPTANRTKSSILSTQPNGELRKRKLASNRLQSISGETASIPTLKLKKTNGAKVAKFDNIRKSRRSGRFSQQPVSDSTSITTDSIALDSHEGVSDIQERYPSDIESTVPTDNVDPTERLMASSEVKLPSPIVVCGIHTTEFNSTPSLSSPSPQTHPSTDQEASQKRARKLSGVPQSPTLTHAPTTDTKYVSPLGSPRQTRVSRALSSTLDTPASSPMPPPRQTKTLAAVREKLRAKRMLKEAERQSPSQSYYSLPGSMTPHPASGASGYFHQPSSYPSSGGFGALSTESTKRSSSALSSPRSLQSLSPRPCDKQLPTNNTTPMTLTTLLHTVPENDSSKVTSASPVSPCSLPNAELLSPLPNLCLTTELPSLLGDQDPAAFTLDFAAQSYPSSPQSSISPLAMNGPLSFDPTRSPQSARGSILPYHFEYPHEQSTSAPPTPSTHQSGQPQGCSLSNVSPSSTLITGIASNSADLMENFLTAVSLPNSTTAVTLRSTSLNATLPIDAGTIQTVPFSHSIDPPITGNPVVSTVSHIALQPPVPALSPLCSSQSLPSLYPSISTNSPVSSQSFQPTLSQTKLLRDTTQCTMIPSTTVSPSIPSAVSQLLVGSGSNSSGNNNNNKPSTTTRAFFVDGDNLSQALALLQSLNPKATITQQQFLLIPSANKSQMFLLRPPASKSPATSASQPSTPLSVSASQSSSPSTVNFVRQTVNSAAASPTAPSCSYSGDFRPMFDAQVSSPSPAVTFVTSVSNQILSRTLSTPGGEGVAVPVNIRPRLAPTEASVSVYQNLSTVPPPPPPPLHPRTIVCSTSSLSSPTLLQLKPQPHARPISTVDLDQDRIGPKPRSGSPKIALPPVHNNKVSTPTATVLCANPSAQPQITLSLLTSSPSLLNNEAPLVLLTDSLRPAPTAVHPNTRQVSLLQANMVEQAYSVYTQSSPGNNPLLTPSPMTVINPSSSSLSLGASPIPTVPNPSFYTNSFSTLSREPTVPQYTTTICGNKYVTADQLPTVIQTNPVNCYPTTMVQTLPVNYLPAATIVSHCSPALVFPHTMQTLHPDQTHLVSRDNGTQFNRPSL